jgi:hypothetical protein
LLVDPYPDTARTASAAHASKASPRATVGGCRGGGCLTLTSTYLQVTVRARIACFCRLWKWFFKEMAGVTNLSSSPRRCKFFSTREVRCCLLRGWDGINGDQSNTTVLYCTAFARDWRLIARATSCQWKRLVASELRHRLRRRRRSKRSARRSIAITSGGSDRIAFTAGASSSRCKLQYDRGAEHCYSW